MSSARRKARRAHRRPSKRSTKRRSPQTGRRRSPTAARPYGGAARKRRSRVPILVVGAVIIFVVGFALGSLRDREPVATVALDPPARPQNEGTSGERSPENAEQSRMDQTVEAPASVSPPASVDGPLVSLVIDDLGRDPSVLEELGDLGVEISYAVLPFEQRTQDVVRRLNERGDEVLLHLPMQARGDSDPGPGALFLSMSEEELRARTRRALRAVPGAVGVNNHMGSAFSSNARAMKTVLEIVAESELFFLDSRTSSGSQGYEVARELSLPAVERSVFLDDSLEIDDIRQQFRLLLERSLRDGAAVAIGHPHRVTLEVLREEVPAALQAGYRFVKVSTLLEGSSVETM